MKIPTRIELERELCRRSFAEFCKRAWHVLEPAVPMAWGWALDAMCEHLEAVHRGQIKRLLINVPPGMMKSLMTGVFFPAWEWCLSTIFSQPVAQFQNQPDPVLGQGVVGRPGG